MTVIDDYFKNLDTPEKLELERVRKVIKQFLPDTVEVISYGMPGFKYKNKYLCGFNAFKDHFSFFPTAEPIEALKNQLKTYKTSKGTILYTLKNPLTSEIIKELVKIRASEIDKEAKK